MTASLLPLPVPLEVTVVIAGALWMTLAPQIPAGARHRGLLAALTWGASRALLAWLARADAAALTLSLAADLVAWRALADWGGEGGEAAWAWAATPAVVLFVMRAGPLACAGGACVALALVFVRRGWALAAGLVLGTAVALAGPWFALAALPFVLGAWRRPGTLVALLAPAACGLLLSSARPWAHVLNVAWPQAMSAPAPESGPTLWRVPASLGLALPPNVAWAIAATVGAWGAWRLARRHAEAVMFGAWGFATLAALAPGITGAHLLVWLPFVCAWCANDPDRRGWWIIEGFLLPLALLLESSGLRGAAGTLGHYIALAGILGCGALALWPLHTLSVGGTPSAERPGTK